MDYRIRGILQARILEWVTFPFSRGLSQPRGQTQVSLVAGGFFTSQATVLVLVAQSCPTLCDPMDCSHQAPLSMRFFRQGYWSGLPFPSAGDFPNSGIEPRSPALQADSLLTELQGKPQPSHKGISHTGNSRNFSEEVLFYFMMILIINGEVSC